MSRQTDRIRSSGHFEIDDIELLRDAFVRYNFAPGTPWDDLRGTFLALPGWFRSGLDPMSDEYAQQQRRLWAEVAGVDRAYDPQLDEETSPHTEDAVRLPGFFVRRDAGAIAEAANQILASGIILKHSGLQPGQWALEYGAGFGLTALSMARLGVNVDTVDISRIFCRHVQAQADFYRVPLRPFHGQFGWNPRADMRYDFIWFFECFHHCLDFKNVVRQIKEHLAPGGRIMLAGEPIMRGPSPIVPYPWGLRLESDVVAIIREKRWFELGFSEDFLVSLFTMAGFSAERVTCPEAPYGEGYLFRHRTDRIDLSAWLPSVQGATWHEPEPSGRWSKDESRIALDTTDSFERLAITATNHHASKQAVEIVYGSECRSVTFQPGERRTIEVDARVKAPSIEFRATPMVPSDSDPRALGIFVHEIRYA